MDELKKLLAEHPEEEVIGLNRQTVLGLIERLEKSEAENLALHRKLAAATLLAEQGWQRYEAANERANASDAQLEAAVAQLDKQEKQ